MMVNVMKSTRAEMMRRRMLIAWCRETSADQTGWSTDHPSRGQCAVTSLLVQDYYGGELVRVEYQTPDGVRGSHYFNKIANGEVIDLTRDQFPAATVFTEPEFRSRAHVLSSPDTRYRYGRLIDHFMVKR